MPVTLTTAEPTVEDVSSTSFERGSRPRSRTSSAPRSPDPSLLDSADLPGRRHPGAHRPGEAPRCSNAGELIDEILFLSELREAAARGRLARRDERPARCSEQGGRGARRPPPAPGSRWGGDRRCGRRPAAAPLDAPIVAENLAENAIQIRRPRRCRSRRQGTRDIEGAQLVASDDGIGIGEADSPRIFERFWRADASGGERAARAGPCDREARRRRSWGRVVVPTGARRSRPHGSLHLPCSASRGEHRARSVRGRVDVLAHDLPVAQREDVDPVPLRSASRRAASRSPSTR